MKKGSEHPDSTRKKLVGEYLRNADKLLKSGDYDQALSEVEKSLELEPGNFYAQAYRDRITALREKHGRSGEAYPSPPVGGSDVPAGSELTEITGARIEEVPAGEAPLPDQQDIAELRDQIARDRATLETETHRQTEEFARNALEEELRQRKESERLKVAELHAVAEALAGARADAVSEVIARSREAFGKLLSGGDTEGAFRELARIMIIDPAHVDLDDLTKKLETATRARVNATAGELKLVPREIILQWFGKLLRSAWGEGMPNRVQAEALVAARTRFAVTAEEEKTLLSGIQRKIMTDTMREAYKSGDPDPETKSFLETLARELSVGDVDTVKASVTK